MCKMQTLRKLNDQDRRSRSDRYIVKSTFAFALLVLFGCGPKYSGLAASPVLTPQTGDQTPAAGNVDARNDTTELSGNQNAGVTPTTPPIPMNKSIVMAPFQLEMARSDMNAIFLETVTLPSLEGVWTQSLPDFAVTDPLSVSVSGIQLSLKYAFNIPVLDADSQTWHFSARSLSADLNVSDVEASALREIDSNGNSLTVRLNGSCHQVHFNLPEGASSVAGTIKMTLDPTGRPHFELVSLDSNWTPGAWQVASLNCNGPGGFDHVVAEVAENRLRQVDPFLAQIREQIGDAIQKLVTNPLTVDVGVSPNVSLQLTMRALNTVNGGSHAETSDQVAIVGDAIFDFKDVPPKSGCGAQVADFKTPPNTSAQGDSLLLPAETIQELVTCAYMNQALMAHFDSSQISGFTKLEHSTWAEKLLVWPDLFHFHKNAVFDFDVNVERAPVIANLRSVPGHSVVADMVLPIKIDMNAPQGKGYVPYIHVHSGLTGPVAVDISAGQVKVTVDPASTLQITRDWDPKYLAAHHWTFQRIWMSKLISATKSFLQGPGLTLPLPKLNISNKLGLTIHEATTDGPNIRLGVLFDRP